MVNRVQFIIPPVFQPLFNSVSSEIRSHNTALAYTAAGILSAGCTMLAGICIVRWIPPAEIGIWQTARLAIVYAMFLLAGINNGLSRELPFAMGKGREEESKILASSALTFVLSIGLFTLVIGCLSLPFFRKHGAQTVSAVFAVTLTIAFTYYSNYLVVTFRSSKSFADLTKIKLTEASIAILSLGLVYTLGYRGMLVRAVLMVGIVCSLMHWFRPLHVTPRLNRGAMVLLFKTGAPIFVMDYLSNAAATADRVVLLKLGGVEQVGFYAMALMAREAIAMVPGALSEYVYPRMSYSFGKNSDSAHLWRLALKSSALGCVGMIPIALVGWFAIPPIVEKFFPKYTEGVYPAQLLVLGSIATGATLGRMAIWSMKNWRLMFLYQLLNAVVVIISPIIGGYLSSRPIVGVSGGLAVGQLIWCPIAWVLIYVATHPNRSGDSANAS
jgi:O-antigen/teichoic acid export membrane protein